MSVIIYPSTCLTKPKLCRILSRPNIRRDVLCRGPSEPKSTIVMTCIYLLHLSWKSQKVPALQWATLEPLQFPFRSSSATPSSKCQPHVTCADRLWSQPRHPTVSHTWLVLTDYGHNPAIQQSATPNLFWQTMVTTSSSNSQPHLTCNDNEKIIVNLFQSVQDGSHAIGRSVSQCLVVTITGIQPALRDSWPIDQFSLRQPFVSLNWGFCCHVLRIHPTSMTVTQC